MPTLHGAITYMAQKATAFIARQHSATLRMIKATGFTLLLNGFWSDYKMDPIDGRKNRNVSQLTTALAVLPLRVIPSGDFNGPLASGATNLPHGCLVSPNHARITKMIVQCPFLIVNTSDDVADGKCHAA